MQSSPNASDTSLEEPARIWKASLGMLEIQLARPIFNTFLKETSASIIRNGVLVITTPNSFAAEYLEKKLFTQVHSCVASVAKDPLGICFEVATSERPLGISPPPSLSPQAHPIRLERLSAPPYTFTSFIVGVSNELAYAAAKQASEQPGRRYNPVFIHSSPGLGKTHLLYSIHRRSTELGLSSRFTSSEKFTNGFIHAIRNGKIDEFRALHRSLDLLLIDDVQFLGGKQQTQEGFFHIFNELFLSGCQIVLTGDRPPSEVSLLQRRLGSRFEGGLVVDMLPPSIETRFTILVSKASELDATLPDEVLSMVSQHSFESVRLLEGALKKIIALSEFTGKKITPALAQGVLGSTIYQMQPLPVSPEIILDTIASYYEVDLNALKGFSRGRQLTSARHILVYLLRETCHQSFSTIGALLGGRDHSTIMHSWRKIQASTTDPNIAQDLTRVKERLFNRKPPQ